MEGCGVRSWSNPQWPSLYDEEPPTPYPPIPRKSKGQKSSRQPNTGDAGKVTCPERHGAFVPLSLHAFTPAVPGSSLPRHTSPLHCSLFPSVPWDSLANMDKSQGGSWAKPGFPGDQLERHVTVWAWICIRIRSCGSRRSKSGVSSLANWAVSPALASIFLI